MRAARRGAAQPDAAEERGAGKLRRSAASMCVFTTRTEAHNLVLEHRHLPVLLLHNRLQQGQDVAHALHVVQHLRCGGRGNRDIVVSASVIWSENGGGQRVHIKG